MIAKMVLGSTHLAYLPPDFGDRLEEKKKKRNFWRNVFKTCRTIVRHLSFFLIFAPDCTDGVFFFLYRCVSSPAHDTHQRSTHTHTLDECFYTCLFMSTASFLSCFLFLCCFFSARRCQSFFFVCVALIIM